VIDEQHKFGVNQRARIRKLGVDPHYLVMTATPIPRTVALTVFGDLDTSIIRELPPGRQPVETRWVQAKQRDRVYERLRAGMLEEHAERFGLSQLHQFRGRISRGTVAGHCYLFAEPAGDDARDRLRILTRTTDGFVLAEEDVRLRGLGEFFGTSQHGVGELRI